MTEQQFEWADRARRAQLAVNELTGRGSLTAAEYDEIIGAIWQGLDDDPRRFNDLLSDACAFIGTLAIRASVHPELSLLAARCLRGMQARAIAGPNHEQEDHR